ncbi:uncharacterized protein HMPREF1541_05057 [Cyphellophora europaea CBS 101466]|uniref:Uncharacterized protein n=1 Tax=Cyphellophora europaea (strain CBS 101466) TaxID=1220924 RepID=W2RWF8_CYPE1|nr:uncharacterized protein HMPREF1541_05057 [Cyphellophora europaea CBS 101466]ETN40777.1 hypothetical protein HMPREF1541_05057 [Cyphellophora europaea CBS 101466]
MSASTVSIPSFEPPAEHTTLTATLQLSLTATMSIYQCTPPTSPPLSWVQTAYHPPPTESPDHATHPLLSIPPHWHAHHDEIMTVTSGRMKFSIGGQDVMLGHGEGCETNEAQIKRGTVHGFTVLRGEAAEFRERTVPQGPFKGAFFQDLFAAGEPGVLHAMRTFADGDTYVALPGGWKWLDYWVTCALGALGKLLLPYREAPVMVAEIAKSDSSKTKVI